jgi:hypothetical protein
MRLRVRCGGPRFLRALTAVVREDARPAQRMDWPAVWMSHSDVRWWPSALGQSGGGSVLGGRPWQGASSGAAIRPAAKARMVPLRATKDPKSTGIGVPRATPGSTRACPPHGVSGKVLPPGTLRTAHSAPAGRTSTAARRVRSSGYTRGTALAASGLSVRGATRLPRSNGGGAPESTFIPVRAATKCGCTSARARHRDGRPWPTVSAATRSGGDSAIRAPGCCHPSSRW